jgi:predicted transcriptional regulator
MKKAADVELRLTDEEAAKLHRLADARDGKTFPTMEQAVEYLREAIVDTPPLTDEQASRLHKGMDASKKIAFPNAKAAVRFLKTDRAKP